MSNFVENGYLRVVSECGDEDDDSIPIVVGVDLGGAALGVDSEARRADAVGVGEQVVDGLGTALRELEVVLSRAGVFVGVATDDDVNAGVVVEVLSYVVDVDHFLFGDLVGIDGETDGGEHRRGDDLCFIDLCYFGAGEL